MTAAEQTHTLWKDMGHYMMWWICLFGLAGLLTPVTSAVPHQRLMQAGWGMFFGGVCGLVFTLSQNTFNKSRNKPASWGIAIAIWMGMKFVFRALM